MPTINPRVDEYIESRADFARPILEHLRALVHEVCPDVVETIKWGMPHFEHKGVICHMAAFKNHCAFGFWKQSLLGREFVERNDAMSSFGKITSRKDLPSDKRLKELIRKAVELNEAGIKVERMPKKDLEIPAILTKALKKAPAAKKTFDEFPTSKRRDYVDWINEAKTDATREKRLATTIEQLAEGKSRNWKYEKKKS